MIIKEEENLKKEHNSNNVFAHTIKGDVIHISNAESGRKGYYCMGCKKQMQAVHSQYQNRISYFRHDATDVKRKGTCTYSDETYRHKLGKEILQRTKSIKVPTVYKYPPKGTTEKAYVLLEATFVNADEVRNELYFYEDESGFVRWNKKMPPGENFLLIKPDVAFFDAANKPILLIELVATHKVSETKKIKIMRLGIDTVQVVIPKSSPEEIEVSFGRTKHTKWIYNYEESNTEYVSDANRDTETVSQTDEVQRKLFEESLSCRISEIGNLIRSINKCLESEQYRESEGRIEREIQRVEENAEGVRDRIFNRDDGYRIKSEEKYSTERGEIKDQEEQLQSDFVRLEGRYRSRKLEIEREYQVYEDQIRSIEGRRGDVERKSKKTKESFARLHAKGERVDQDQERIRQEEGELEQTISREERDSLRDNEEAEREESESISEIIRRTESLPAELQEFQETTRKKFEELESATRNKHERIAIEIKRDIKRINETRDGFTAKHDAAEFELRQRFERFRTEVIKSIEERVPRGNDRFVKRHENLAEGYGLLKDLLRIQRASERIGRAREAFVSGAYKEWIK